MASNSVASINTVEYDTLIAVLREAREEKKIGQEKLSKLLGQPRNFVQNIERKHRRVDPLEVVLIAKALQIDPMELFGQFVRRIR